MSNKQLRINSKTGYPQVIVTQLKWLDGEYQIEQGTGNGDVDLTERHNDVISIRRDQAILLAETILKYEGELV